MKNKTQKESQEIAMLRDMRTNGQTWQEIETASGVGYRSLSRLLKEPATKVQDRTAEGIRQAYEAFLQNESRGSF